MTAARSITSAREGAPSGAPRPLKRAVAVCPYARCGYMAVREAFQASDARSMARAAEQQHWVRMHKEP